MDRTGVVFMLLLLIVLVWFYTSGRLIGIGEALSGKKVLR